MKLVYPAIFYEDKTTNTYTVVFPDLPGCITQGDTIEEALEMAEDAASGWILSSIEDGESINPPSRDIKCEDKNSFVNYVSLDIDEYAKLNSSKSIKKTLTIPQWLNTLAEREGINFSKVLQQAIKQKLGLISTSNSYDEDIAIKLGSSIVTKLQEIIPRLETSISNLDEVSSTTNSISQNRIKLRSSPVVNIN